MAPPKILILGSTDFAFKHTSISGDVNQLFFALQQQQSPKDERLAVVHFSPSDDSHANEKRLDWSLCGFDIVALQSRGIPIPGVIASDEFPKKIPYLLLHQYLDMDKVSRKASLTVYQRQHTHTIMHANSAGVFGIHLRRIAIRRSFPFVASHHDYVRRFLEHCIRTVVQSLKDHSRPLDQSVNRDFFRELFPFLADEPELFQPIADILADTKIAYRHLSKSYPPLIRQIGRAFFALGKRLNGYVYDKVEGGKALVRIHENLRSLNGSIRKRYGVGDQPLAEMADPVIEQTLRLFVHRYLGWFYRPAEIVLIFDEAEREFLHSIGVPDNKIHYLNHRSTNLVAEYYDVCQNADERRSQRDAQIPHVESLTDFQWKPSTPNQASFKPFCTISDLHLADGDSFDRMEALAELYPLLHTKGIKSIIYNGDLGELSASRKKYQSHRNRINWVRHSYIKGITDERIPQNADAFVSIAALKNGVYSTSQKDKVIRQMIKSAGRAGLRLHINGDEMGILVNPHHEAPRQGSLIDIEEMLLYGNHDEGLTLEDEFPGIRPARGLVHFDEAMGAVFTHGHILGLDHLVSAITESDEHEELISQLSKSRLGEALETQEVLHDLATLCWRYTERALNSRWLWKHALQPTVSRVVRRLRKHQSWELPNSMDDATKSQFWASLISPADDVERCAMLASAFHKKDQPSWVCCYGHSHIPAIDKINVRCPKTGQAHTKMVVNSGKFHGDLITAAIVNFPEITIFYWSKRDKQWRMHMYECLSDSEIADVLGRSKGPPVTSNQKTSRVSVDSGFVMHEVPTEGDGHITRFCALYPEYLNHGDVCSVLSGPRANRIDIPGGAHHRCCGLQIRYRQDGGVDTVGTTNAYFAQIRKVVREARLLAPAIPKFAAIVSDYGPTVKLAHKEATREAKKFGRLNSLPDLYAISHQASLDSQQKHVPRPPTSFSNDIQQRTIDMLRGTVNIGFHYERYSEEIMPPMIRPPVFSTPAEFDGDFVMVYLRGALDRIIQFLSGVSLPIRWKVFHRTATQVTSVAPNISVHPTSREVFTRDLFHCKGVFADAGFGLTSEALHLGLPLVCRPIPRHYEQQCNAAALALISSVGIVRDFSLKEDVQILRSTLGETLDISQPLQRCGSVGPIKPFPNVAQEVVAKILKDTGYQRPTVTGDRTEYEHASVANHD